MKVLCYSFDSFRLFPSEFRLERANIAVKLTGKPFQILVAIVTRDGLLKKRSEIFQEVWGTTSVETRTLNTHLSTLRSVLGDDDDRPLYIETVHGIGFKFIATFTKEMVEMPGAVASLPTENTGYVVEAHRFVPIYLGTSTITGSIRRDTKWGRFSECEVDEGKLSVTDIGVGVWDIKTSEKFHSLTDLALWRRSQYQLILRGRHAISKRTSDLVSQSTKGKEAIAGVSRQFEYVLSFFSMTHYECAPHQLKSALKLVSCPKILLEGQEVQPDKNRAFAREQMFLGREFEHPDLREFGVFDTDFGYAGWSGISHCGFGKSDSPLARAIVDFEIALQSLWLYCHCVNQRVANGQRLRESKIVSRTIEEELARLVFIGPTERTEERMMCEALIETSRIKPQSQSALDAISRSNGK